MDNVLTIIYCIMCLCMFAYNYMKYGKILNALNVYLIVWLLMVLCYNMKLILYYDLTALTWILIFASTVLVFLGYRLGSRIKAIGKRTTETEDASDGAFNERSLKKIIIITSLISMVAIVPNTLLLIQRYGINLLSKTNQIYYDNIAGGAPFSIPYLAAFAQVSCVFAGMYFAKYEFRLIIALPIALAMISILPSGSRGWLLLTVFLFLYPAVFFKNPVPYNVKVMRRKMNKNRLFKKKLILIFSMTIILALFLVLTINRSRDIDPELYNYLDSKMYEITRTTPWITKLYQYFASPIGVLNSFLQEPEFYFGKNTFSVIYNFLNKFGFDIDYSRYQDFYNIPIKTNVGTWIRELVQDFNIVGMLIVIFVFSVLVGYYDKKARRYKQKDDVLLATVLDTILTMSFFVWYLREGTMAVIILSCIIIKVFRKRKYIIKVDNAVSRNGTINQPVTHSTERSDKQ